MSVKKIGKAIFLKHVHYSNTPLWSVIGGSYYFGPEWQVKYDVNAAIGYRPSDKVKRESWDNQRKDFIEKVAKEIETESSQHPLCFILYKSVTGSESSDSIYCMCRGNIYKFDRPGYSDEEMLFQIIELEDKERQKFERLKNKFSLAKEEEKEPRKRTPIPEEVRIAVWRRDEGKCVKCGSRERLEYDHIIPLSKGGSDTVRNIELLCEACNREKCAEIR